MSENTTHIEQAAREHPEKLVGLVPADLDLAAQRGAALVLVARAGLDLRDQDATVTLADSHQTLWLAKANPERLLAWLADDRILAICCDELPDVRLARMGKEISDEQDLLSSHP
jgi:hypothetical protein